MTFLFLALMLLLSVQPTSANSGDMVIGNLPGVLTATVDVNSLYEECSLGCVVADAVRIELDSDVAIICGGDLSGDLLPGETTFDDIKRALSGDYALGTASITMRELRQILEAGLSHIALNEAETIDKEKSGYYGFPQISGFVIYFDASAPPGERVYDIRIGGNSVDLDSQSHVLTLAATENMLRGDYDLPPAAGYVVASNATLFSSVIKYIGDGIYAYSPSETRIHVRGLNDRDSAIIRVPPIVFPAVIVVFLVASATSRTNRSKDEKNRKEETPWY